MVGPVGHYTRWLHTRWPAGVVEPRPQIREDGATAVPGLYIVGDLTGVPLLKFAADSGARAVRTIIADPAFHRRDKASPSSTEKPLDLIIIGGSVSGMAAALEARKHGLSFEMLEAAEPFSTIVNFPKGKPIFTYPTGMTPAGEMQFSRRSRVKEGLLEELRELTRDITPRRAMASHVRRRGRLLDVMIDGGESLPAHRVIVAIGCSGSFRKLNTPGEDLNKVYNRLHDPKDFAHQDVLVVGGGDSALETAIAIAECGGRVTMVYRGREFSRAKPANIDRLRALLADPMADVQVEQPVSDHESTAVGRYMAPFRKPGTVRLMLASEVQRITEASVEVRGADGAIRTLANDVVFTMIGRDPPLDFFRRSGVPIRGEWRVSTWISFMLTLLVFTFIYHWKKSGMLLGINEYFVNHQWFPYNVPSRLAEFGEAFSEPSHLLGTMRISLGEPGFYYSSAYCLAVLLFGVRRIRRRQTPYITAQTVTLIAIQLLPLFILPYILLPWAGHNGLFDGGAMRSVADALFPQAGHGREYWRSFGFILAWPLFFWNVFTEQPMWTWLGISVMQTFIIIPAIIFYWGKGAYCGWICSCGALAETLGDDHRHKMPHGPRWNRVNMIGQVFLAFAVVLLVLRVVAWTWPGSRAMHAFHLLFDQLPGVNYVWFVDLLWAGIIGVGFYWHFSGRVWCRFACPLAALMHIYARFSRFRIFADKKKCISCNVCTAVCHQGIDIMNFANKGLAMEDPQCVRCSACVQSCPTGVLSFGRLKHDGEARLDRLPASPVQMAELTVNGRGMSLRGWNRGIVWTATLALLAMAALVATAAKMAPAPAANGTPPTSQPTSAPIPTATVDHQALDDILSQSVRDECVDYLLIRKRHYRALLEYLDAMGRVEPASLPLDERLAFYINLYNAAMIRAVVERFTAGYTPAANDFSVFKEPFIELHGRRVSLDEIEHQIIRPTFNDPRIHVALVCAARSCPPLLPHAYRAADLDEVLEVNMRRFIAADPQRNPIDPATGQIRLSQLFNWYASDFGGPENVKAYVDRHHPVDLSEGDVSFVEYDWTLNIAPPVEGRWVVLPSGEVYEVLNEADGRLLLDWPLRDHEFSINAQSVRPYEPSQRR